MVAFNKFNQFPKDLIDGVHDFDAHTFKVMLTETAPTAADAVKADLTEIAPGNGYTAGGSATTISTSLAGSVATVFGTDVVFTATGGPMATLRYAVLYNDSSPSKSLIGYWDYGSAIVLGDTETLTVNFDDVDGILTATI